MKKKTKKLVLAKETVLRIEDLKSAQGGFGEGAPLPASFWVNCKNGGGSGW